MRRLHDSRAVVALLALWQRYGGGAAWLGGVDGLGAVTFRGTKVQELNYHSPTTLLDALTLLARPGARALAGGTDLIPQLREGRRQVGEVIDLKRVPDVTALSRSVDGDWIIGAAVSVGALERNPQFALEHAAVLDAAKLIGSIQIQNRAGLGGNICNAAPSADGVPLLICLDAEADIAGPNGRRRIPIADIATGPGRTSLGPAEILVSIRLPRLPARSSGIYLRFTQRREMDIAIAGVAVWFRVDETNTIVDARVTLASVAPTCLIAKGAQHVLVGQQPSRAVFETAASVAAASAQPISDARGSADYRRQLVGVLTRRALNACAKQLGCALS
jgi:CO/xanthine dehydrogenase FAD-binding subunit